MQSSLAKLRLSPLFATLTAFVDDDKTYIDFPPTLTLLERETVRQISKHLDLVFTTCTDGTPHAVRVVKGGEVSGQIKANATIGTRVVLPNSAQKDFMALQTTKPLEKCHDIAKSMDKLQDIIKPVDKLQNLSPLRAVMLELGKKTVQLGQTQKLLSLKSKCCTEPSATRMQGACGHIVCSNCASLLARCWCGHKTSWWPLASTVFDTAMESVSDMVAKCAESHKANGVNAEDDASSVTSSSSSSSSSSDKKKKGKKEKKKDKKTRKKEKKKRKAEKIQKEAAKKTAKYFSGIWNPELPALAKKVRGDIDLRSKPDVDLRKPAVPKRAASQEDDRGPRVKAVKSPRKKKKPSSGTKSTNASKVSKKKTKRKKDARPVSMPPPTPPKKPAASIFPPFPEELRESRC